MAVNDKLVRDILNELDDYVQEVATDIFNVSQENLLADKKIDTGILFKTANINRDFLRAEIVYPASYAEYVEFGRLPGSMPPVNSLTKWVRRKLSVPEQDVLSTSWAIAKSIERRGIQPARFLRNALETVQNNINSKKVNL